MVFVIVQAEWNAEITDNLCIGAYDTLLEHGVRKEDIVVYKVPGAYELPTGAQWAAEYLKPTAIITLGCVIQGETRHFDFVCEAVSQGVKDVSLKYNKPVIFGLLTDNTIQQSRARAGGKHGNKGVEAAVTAIKMAALQKVLSRNKKSN